MLPETGWLRHGGDGVGEGEELGEGALAFRVKDRQGREGGIGRGGEGQQADVVVVVVALVGALEVVLAEGDERPGGGLVLVDVGGSCTSSMAT